MRPSPKSPHHELPTMKSSPRGSLGATPSYGKEGLVNVVHSSRPLHTVLLKIEESSHMTFRHCWHARLKQGYVGIVSLGVAMRDQD